MVVEGDTDAQWLRTLFPVEFGRAHIMIAGSARQVEGAHETLRQIESTLPWLCIRDRDLLSEEEVSELSRRYANLHVWPRRSIESLLLEANLVAATMQAVGVQRSADEIEQWMQEISEPLQEEVLAAMVEAELRRRFPPPSVPPTLGRLERMKAEAEAYAEINRDRALAIEVVIEEQRTALSGRWAADWKQLVNAKPILAALHARLGSFKSTHDFVSAMMARARDDEAVRPAALEKVRGLVVSRLEHTQG